MCPKSELVWFLDTYCSYKCARGGLNSDGQFQKNGQRYMQVFQCRNGTSMPIPKCSTNKYSECLKSECWDFRQCRNPNTNQFGFQRSQILDILDFWDTHKMFGFQTVPEIQTFEHVPLASKWLATDFFGLGQSLPSRGQN